MNMMFTLLIIVLTVGGSTAIETLSVGTQLISQGKDTEPSTVPWHVGLWRPVNNVYEHFCGGSLVAPHLVISAAHCFWDNSVQKAVKQEIINTYMAALGKRYRSWDTDLSIPSVQRIGVHNVILDDGYDSRHDHDIALVVLKKNATINELVKLIAISWDSSAPACGSVGVVAGWSLTQHRNYSELLQSVQLPYFDHDTCYNLLENDDFKQLLKADMFCAGYYNYRRSVCQGDSGGGYVVVDNRTNVATLRGVVRSNFSPAGYPEYKCYSSFYTGFTNIGEVRYLAWIRRHMGGITCPPVLKKAAVLSVTCLHDSHLVDCNQPMAQGSVTSWTCSQGFLVGNKTQSLATCQSDGSWSTDDFSCAPGYERLPGRLQNFYKFHVTALTWPAAKAACESEGSHLVIINSQAEFTAVRDQLTQNKQKMVEASGTVYAWIGLRESDTMQGEFFTVLGQPRSSTGYSTWNPGQPDDPFLGDYVYIRVDHEGLIDYPASRNNHLAFTCELEVA